VHSQGMAQTSLGSPPEAPSFDPGEAKGFAPEFSSGRSTTLQPAPLHWGQSGRAMNQQ